MMSFMLPFPGELVQASTPSSERYLRQAGESDAELNWMFTTGVAAIPETA